MAAVTVVAGTHSHGQGHETVYAQMVSEWLGVDFASVRMIQGDTDAVGFGRGTYGSRSMTVGGSALKQCRRRPDREGEEDGRACARSFSRRHPVRRRQVHRGRHRQVDRARRPRQAQLRARRLAVRARRRARGGRHLHAARSNFANGCHICEVEVDPETGQVEIVHYIGVDDSGVIINPLLFEGQIHGGLAMGLGQALHGACRIRHDLGPDPCRARSSTIACHAPTTCRRSTCTTCPTAAVATRSA